MVGSQAAVSPDRSTAASPASCEGDGTVVTDEPGPDPDPGGASVAGGRAAGVPLSTAWTTSRWAALNRGLHVVSVSRASEVGSTTETSFGFTTMVLSTSYRYVPCLVTTVIGSPVCSSSSR